MECYNLSIHKYVEDCPILEKLFFGISYMEVSFINIYNKVRAEEMRFKISSLGYH